MTRVRVAYALGALLLAAGAALAGGALLRPAPGTLLVLAAGTETGSLPSGDVAVHSRAGWTRTVRVGATTVPRAPDTVTVARLVLAAGRYDRLRLGGAELEGSIDVVAGLVQPVLVAVSAGRPQPAGLYAGADDVNLGLSELGGALVPMPDFALQDQSGQTLDAARLRGSPVVIAAFHTTCRETCPLYTGLYLELRRRLPRSVHLLEVTTDPEQDTPPALHAYASAVGADWTFGTGGPEALSRFWAPFGVQLSAGDSHVSTLAVVDAHGYIRIVYRGAPGLSQQLPASLGGQLSPEGRRLASGPGDFDAAQVADVIGRLARMGDSTASPAGQAPDIALPGLMGGSVSLAASRGRPVIVNFWASWCGPCRTELPLLQAFADAHPGITVLLVDWRDDQAAARRQATQLGLRLPIGFDPDGRTTAPYSISGLPATVFVRADGSLEGRWNGQLTDSVLAGHAAQIGAGQPTG